MERFSFGFSPTDVGQPITLESNHERILALDLESVNSEKLRDPVRHNLLELGAGDRFEAVQTLAPSELSMARTKVCYISYAENNLLSLQTVVKI